MARCFFKLFFVIPLCLFGGPKFLHISYHKTCLAEIDYVGKELGIPIENRELLSCPKELFDGVDLPWSYDRYVITKEKADAIWQNNKEYFSSFDGFIVSDTALLARIFFQHAQDKPLILWICNRFDFSLTGKGVDPSYYEEFREALKRPNVKAIAYTAYEAAHAKNHYHIDGINDLIQPIGLNYLSIDRIHFDPIPQTLHKKNTFFLRNYLNEKGLKISRVLSRNGIPHYMGPYKGPKDLEGFKGVIHIPSVMSNFALFEQLSLGLVHFIPSKQFYTKLAALPGFTFRFWCNAPFEDIFSYSEWYSEDYKDLFVYFDSWEDLKVKTETLDLTRLSFQAKLFSEKHKQHMLDKWQNIFSAFSF